MSLWNSGSEESEVDGNISTPEVAVQETFDTDISADDEFDVTDDGIPGHRVIAAITAASSVVKEGDGGARNLLYKLSFSVLNSPHINPAMTVGGTFWREHSNPQARQIGRGQFRALVEAVVSKNEDGRTTGNLAGLIGTYVGAWAKQGSGGFPELSRFNRASEDDLNEALGAAGVGELT